MNIIIKDTAYIEVESILSALSDDIKLHLENVFRDLIKSANFQDLQGAEKEEHFYAMLFMQKTAQVLEEHFYVPFKVVDHFTSTIKGKKLGEYAPFFYDGSDTHTRYEFTLAYGYFALTIEVEYKFKAEYQDLYSCPLDECIEYFSDNSFNARIKYISHLQDGFIYINDKRHEIILSINDQPDSLENLAFQLNKTTKREFKKFKQQAPSWLTTCINDCGYLNLIISERFSFISTIINDVFINVFQLNRADIAVRLYKLSNNDICKDGLYLPFSVSIKNSFEFKCCLKLSHPSSKTQTEYLFRIELINYWKKVARTIEVGMFIEGCQVY